MAGNHFKTSVARFLMHRELNKIHRSGEVVSYKDADSIGILYDATAEGDYELIKELVRRMRSEGKDVVALGYFNRKELPNTRFMKLGLDFFTRKALNWKMKPGNGIVNNFMHKGFDILICLNLNSSIPLRYVAAHTKARFKIGKYDTRTPHVFDIFIKTEERYELKDMIYQIEHYLTLIRNDQYQKA
ncbi:MAG TPA: hypothetical protein VFW78_11420 [Bacteroidia bacterium]|nr:hypothetical protein [Bacteroidia bacterium]